MSKTPAERSAAYRARKRENGERAASGKSNYKDTKWDQGQFIALDGEGESVGELEKFEVGKEGKIYHAKKHNYTLLAASTGESLYNGGKRLDSQSCIDFLLDLGAEYPKGIFVIFAGSYDINHMFMFGFERDILQRISRGETVTYDCKGVGYSIEYRARKSLTLRRGGVWRKNDKSGKWSKKYSSSITVWDTFGFFQESFVGVLGKWLGKDYCDYELIKRMKSLRGDFAAVKQSDINEYNAAELRALVAIMDKVRDAITGLDLKCRRWDGAGSIAASIMRAHKIKDFKKDADICVIEAIRCAYAGGRIEVCKIGNYEGHVYDYDVNSAYPFVMLDLPCMQHGIWKHTGKTNHLPQGFSLVHLRYNFQDGLPFYPLFYRTEKMQISFPASGEGWYWLPEARAALLCPGELEILESWTFIESCNHKPFHWIDNYYAKRKQWIKNPTEEWQRGGEKIIKLGINSLYGKTAQQIGGKINKPPAYHQLEWAGYITSATRARLYSAAMERPSAVIGFATDGIFTTEKLPIETSITKEIGAWELKEPIPVGMTTAMAGVYWWHYENNEYGHFSRGFDKDSMKTPDKIIDAWKKGFDSIDVPMHRLIGMGSACASEALWPMRGRFTQGFRSLRLDGKSHKRQAINIKRQKPYKQLVDLQPSLNIEYGYQSQGCSHPYPVLWLDANLTDDYETDLELQKENLDTENI